MQSSYLDLNRALIALIDVIPLDTQSETEFREHVACDAFGNALEIALCAAYANGRTPPARELAAVRTIIDMAGLDPEPLLRTARARADGRYIASVARGMLSGEVHLVEGIRAIVRTWLVGEASDDDEELAQFRTFEAVTDDYLAGEVRERYSAEFVRNMDASFAPYIEKLRPDVDDACRRLIARCASPETM